MRVKRVVESVVWLTIASSLARADTVYSSFLPGNMYQCCFGYEVSGSSNQVAGAFTPAGNYALTQIDLAVTWLGDPWGSDFSVSVDQDSAGLPGATIEAWTGVTAPYLPPGPSSLVETVFPMSSVALVSGNQYWIVVSPGTLTTYDDWDPNATSDGPGGRIAINSGSGWNVVDLPANDIAFDIQGTPGPEPSTLTLVSSCLAGLVLIRKRRWRPAPLTPAPHKPGSPPR
jgi:hypothetical protein